MWQRKTAVLFALGLISAFIGLILGNYQLVTLAAVFLAPLTVAFFTFTNDVAIQRTIAEEKIFEEDRLEVTVTVTNRSGRRHYIEVFDRLPAEVRVVEGTNRLVLPARPHKPVQFRYIIECPLRGYYLLGPTKVRSFDYFGFFAETRTVNTRTHLTVYPRVDSATDPQLSSRLHKVHLGTYALHQPGYGTEFHHIRDYEPSDAFKMINWKVSARRRRLMVNQKETEDICNAFIIVDARAGTDAGTPLDNALERSIKAALAIADRLVRRANRVTLITYGETIEVLRPTSDHGQYELFLSALTGTYSRGSKQFGDVIKQIQPYLTPRSPVILISNLEHDPSIRNTMDFLLAGAYRLSIVCPSSIELERAAARFPPPKYQLIALERSNFIDDLRAHGVPIVDWTPDLPLGAIVKEVAS